MIDHTLGRDLEFNKITEQIYIGTTQCCGVRLADELVNDGVTAVISLESERVDSPFGVNAYLWLPTLDNQAPTVAQLWLGVDFIRRVVGAGEKVFVHCLLGHGRSPLMVASYFVAEGMSVEQAWDKILAARPVAHLNALQLSALHNFANQAR